ncbi:MAG: hypothetical protein LBJ89_00355 [Holosporales bacterium]|nr:hypothetical protein [Holosporales bacterium]
MPVWELSKNDYEGFAVFFENVCKEINRQASLRRISISKWKQMLMSASTFFSALRNLSVFSYARIVDGYGVANEFEFDVSPTLGRRNPSTPTRVFRLANVLENVAELTLIAAKYICGLRPVNTFDIFYLSKNFRDLKKIAMLRLPCFDDNPYEVWRDYIVREERSPNVRHLLMLLDAMNARAVLGEEIYRALVAAAEVLTFHQSLSSQRHMQCFSP